MSDVVENSTEVQENEQEEVSRIPEILEENPIFASLLQKYLGITDTISDYNKEVLAEKDSEWTPQKVVTRAKELSYPEDASEKPNLEIQKLYKAYEKATDAFNRARKAVVEKAAEELGISLSSTVERDPEKEAALKEERKTALSLMNTLGDLSKMINDEKVQTAIRDFLKNNEVPAVGRKQSHSYENDSKGTTPKYRVHVTVKRSDSDGEVVYEEDSFTKTALGLAKYYERGKNPITSDVLREVWEKAGNSAEDMYRVSPVTFYEETGDYFFILSRKEGK